MGQGLTKEEECFVRGEYSEAVVAAVDRMAAHGERLSAAGRSMGPPSASGHGGEKGVPFAMTPVEWEVLGSLCEAPKADPTRVIQSAAAKLEVALGSPSTVEEALHIMWCPVLHSAAYLIGFDAGVKALDAARERWVLHLKLAKRATEPQEDGSAGQLEPVHLHVMELFNDCCSSWRDAKSTRRAAAAVRATLENKSLGVAGRPVLQLVLRYAAASSFLHAGEALLANSPSDSDRLEACRHFLDCIDAAKACAQATKAPITFVATLFDRASRALMDEELRSLALSLPSPPPTSTGEAPSWSTLSDVFVGQRDAIDYLRNHFRAKANGLIPADKPTVVVFFGPSGHGKTELAKLVAAVESGEENPEASGDMVHVHMSSYCTRDSIYSLVDPPAAHVGEGLLISALRRRETAVVVLDEFEKSTADAVQNVWLSAFPKHGMLRSLKDASRSVSTTKACFVLTCNTLASEIEAAREEYRLGSEAKRLAFRTSWADRCREQLRLQFGEPFVARIDSFIPFVPYSEEETHAYVGVQLNDLRRRQRALGRDVLCTESFEAFLSNEMASRGFHGSRVERLLQEHLLALADATQPEGRRASCSSSTPTTVVPASNYLVLHMSPSLVASEHPPAVRFIGARQLSEAGLPGATALAREIGRRAGAQLSAVSAPAQFPAKALASPRGAPCQASGVVSPSSTTPASARSFPGATSDDTDLQKAPLELMPETERELELHQELEKERETTRQLRMEVATLKETVKQLETALALALCAIVALLLFLSLFVSLTTLISWVAISVAATLYLVDNAALLIAAAVRGFLRLVGPWKAGALVAIMSGWLVYHGWADAPSCPPCAMLH